jgi:hypothetical protein
VAAEVTSHQLQARKTAAELRQPSTPLSLSLLLSLLLPQPTLLMAMTATAVVPVAVRQRQQQGQRQRQRVMVTRSATPCERPRCHGSASQSPLHPLLQLERKVSEVAVPPREPLTRPRHR